MDEKRTCKKCGVEKRISMFYPVEGKGVWLRTCKACVSKRYAELAKARYQENLKKRFLACDPLVSVCACSRYYLNTNASGVKRYRCYGCPRPREKKCYHCGRELKEDKFRIYQSGEMSSSCIECSNNKQRARKNASYQERLKSRMDNGDENVGLCKCSNYFIRRRVYGTGVSPVIRNTCLTCRREDALLEGCESSKPSTLQ